MGLDRNSNSDAGRRGAASHTKGTEGYEYTMPNPKGRFLPAYTTGMGKTAQEFDPTVGTVDDEVGNDDD